MKKTLLITLEYLPQIGGVANHLAKFSEHMPSDKIVVLTKKNYETRSVINNFFPYKIYRDLPTTTSKLFLTRLLRHLLTIKQIVKIARHENIKYMLAGQLLPIGTSVLLASLLLRIPYGVITYGIDLTLPRKQWRKKILATLVLKKARFVIVSGLFTKQLASAYNIENKIEIISPTPFVSKGKLNESKLMKIKSSLCNDGKKILLSVGRLIPRKGHKLVLKTIRDLPNIYYLIIGKGSEKKDLEKLILDYKIENRVKILDNVDYNELPYYYELSDLFILTPLNIADDFEGFGLVYLEANSFGKPVIATAVGGVSDAVKNNINGLLLEKTDCFLIKQALVKFINDEKFYQKLSSRAEQYVNNEFNWQKSANKLMALLK